MTEWILVIQDDTQDSGLSIWVKGGIVTEMRYPGEGMGFGDKMMFMLDMFILCCL